MMLRKGYTVIKHHKIISTLILILVLFAAASIVTYGADHLIENVSPLVREQLEKSHWNNFLTSILRSFGFYLYRFLGMIFDLLSDGFMILAKWDIYSIEPLQQFNVNMKQLINVCVPLCLVITIVIKLFRMENALHIIYNAIMTMMLIALFLGVMGIASNLKNLMLDEITQLAGVKQEDTWSEAMFKSNTVDLRKSVETNRIFYLSEHDHFDMNGFDSEIVISKDFLGTKLVTNINGDVESEKMADGAMGVGDERYYAYKTNYYSLNATLFVTIIIGAFALYRLAYIIGEWIMLNLGGSIIMLKGFNDLSNAGRVYMEGANALVSICVIYFTMMIYTIISQAVISTNAFGNWLINVIVLLGLGMAALYGTNLFNKALGVDDGSSAFLMKSLFMGRSLRKMGKGLMHGAGNILHKGADAVSAGSEAVASGISNAIHRDEYRRNAEYMEEDRDRFIKEKMQLYNPEQSMIETSANSYTKMLEDNDTSDGRLTPAKDDVLYAALNDGSLAPLSKKQADTWKRNIQDNTYHPKTKSSQRNAYESFLLKDANKNQTKGGVESMKQDILANNSSDRNSNQESTGTLQAGENENYLSGNVMRSKINQKEDKADTMKQDILLNDFDDFNNNAHEKAVTQQTQEQQRETYLSGNDMRSRIDQISSDSFQLEYNGKTLSMQADTADRIKSDSDFYDMIDKDHKEMRLNNGEKAELYNQLKAHKEAVPKESDNEKLRRFQAMLKKDLDGFVPSDPQDDAWFQEDHSRRIIDDNYSNRYKSRTGYKKGGVKDGDYSKRK